MEAFVAVADSLSFRVAAEKLVADASNVSRLVSSLERDLQIALLHRTTRRMTLTPDGEIVLERCRVLLEQARGLTRGLEDEDVHPR